MFETLTPFLIFTQVVGFLAFSVGMVSYQFKEQRKMFGLRVCADMLWTAHYFMLGALTPALTVGIAFVRTFLVVFVWPQHKTKVIVGAVLGVLAVCLITFDGRYINLLPAFTAVIYGLSVYYHEDYMKSRSLLALGAVFWILIGVTFGSMAEVVSSSISLVSVAVGYGRHRRKGIHMQA